MLILYFCYFLFTQEKFQGVISCLMVMRVYWRVTGLWALVVDRGFRPSVGVMENQGYGSAVAAWQEAMPPWICDSGLRKGKGGILVVYSLRNAVYIGFRLWAESPKLLCIPFQIFTSMSVWYMYKKSHFDLTVSRSSFFIFSLSSWKNLVLLTS